MCSKVLSYKGKVIHRTSVFQIPAEDINTEAFKDTCNVYKQQLAQNVGQRDPSADDGFMIEDEMDTCLANAQDNEEDTPQFDFFDTDSQMPEADDVDFDAYDKFISAKVMLPSKGVHKLGTVRKRKRDDDGEPVGKSDPNPIKVYF